MMNKKGQTFSGFMLFAVIVIGLLVASPFLIKFFTSPVEKFGDAVGAISPEAGQAVDFVQDKTLSFWDSVVLFMFLILFIVLIVSSFLIDVHPFFVVIYIISGVLFFAFAPAIQPMMEKIYASPTLSTEVSYIPALEFLVGNFWPVMLGIFIFSGVIIFVKVSLFSSSGGRR